MQRIRKLLKWGSVFLIGLVAVGLVANGLDAHFTESRLKRQLDSIRVAGDPTCIGDLTRPGVPEVNARRILGRAQLAIDAIDSETQEVRPAATCPGFLLSPDEQTVVREVFAAYPKLLPLLEEMAECSNFVEHDSFLPPFDHYLEKQLDLIARQKRTIRVLARRSALLIAEGKRDEALDVVMLGFRLIRHFEHSTTILGSIATAGLRKMEVRATNELLRTGSLSPEALARLDGELAYHELDRGLLPALKGERAFVIDEYSRRFQFTPFATGLEPLVPLWQGTLNRSEIECLELFSRSLQLVSSPDAVTALAAEVKQLRSPLARVLLGGIESCFAASLKAKAEIRAARILIAMQQKGLIESDSPPDREKLGLPQESTLDPFDGQPMRLKHLPSGWLIYSVGPNRIDDSDKNDPTSDDLSLGPPSG